MPFTVNCWHFAATLFLLSLPPWYPAFFRFFLFLIYSNHLCLDFLFLLMHRAHPSYLSCYSVVQYVTRELSWKLGNTAWTTVIFATSGDWSACNAYWNIIKRWWKPTTVWLCCALVWCYYIWHERSLCLSFHSLRVSSSFLVLLFSFFMLLMVIVVFSFVNISQVIGWDGWMVFDTSQEIDWEDDL